MAKYLLKKFKSKSNLTVNKPINSNINSTKNPFHNGGKIQLGIEMI